MLVRTLTSLAALIVLGGSFARLDAWGPQGHRLVALLATVRLSPVAQQNVAWLLPDRSLADVAVWADEYRPDNVQTGPWHYVNPPVDATAYDRDRDCPRQPDVAIGAKADWRDCIVDRILYNYQRLGNPALDRADRATALKFLVYLVGDLHQPFHALVVGRGGNDIPVVVFGSRTCRSATSTSTPCNLHGLWDWELIAHRQLSDAQYLTELSRQIVSQQLEKRATGTPADWTMESLQLAKAALLPAEGIVDEMYYRPQMSVVDQRLALGGLRLAALLNQLLTVAPGS